MNPASPRDNFYRCMTLIVDNGNEAAWELLDFYLSHQGTMLKDFIENNQHEIYHLCFNKGLCCRCQYGPVYKPQSRILYPAQLDILLATKGSNIPCNVHVRAKPTCSHTINDHYANPNIDTKQLDLTLCRCLLINFTNILPQGSVERNAFEDLINMRNKCCHAAKGEISSNNYQTYKAQIEKCLLALAQVYGKTHDMQLKIKDAEKRPLDESICKQLQQTILQEQVLQGVSGLHKHMESSQEAEERTTIEIQKMGKSTKRTLRAVNSSMKSAGHTASKITKIEESTKRTLMVVKSSKRSVERKLKVNTERTTHAIDSSREAEESMATKIQKLDERLSICEISKRSRLLGLTQTEIEGHLMEGTFVETAAVQACIKLLETNSLIVLTGAAGTGKSRNSLEILHQFRVKHPEFDTVKLTDLHDFADVVTAEEKLVILFEDIFGRTNTRFTENTDVQIIDRLHASTIKGNVKVILTVRNTIRTSCQWVFISHKIFHGTCEVDLSSQKFKMTATEKKSLLSKYFVVNNFRLLEVEDQENYFEETILDPQIAVTINRETLNTIVETEPFLGFPEACSLFTGNRKLTRLGLSFFKHPSKYLFEEIEKLRINGADNHQDRMSYITLVYIFLNDDILDPEDIDSERCLEISESCYGISYKKFPICHIRDAANWMIGKYLTLRCNKDTYHFQHQTILESILISYSRIDQNLILSRLSFDFIRELVRLQNYLLKEGEIVMKISPKYYQKLADRIIKIVQSEYFNNSLSITIQLLCDSEIIRENDERFVKCLIDKAHDVYFQPDYALQSYTTHNGEFRLCKLYLPALFLGRIVQQREMNKTITLLLDHLKFILTSDSGDDIKFVCNSSLSEAFVHVCELESNEKILDNVWESVMNLSMFKMTEKMHSIISTVCSRCPVTTMKWMLNNIDRSTFKLNHLINKACEFKRLDVVQLICATVNHDQLDFTSAFLVALNNVRNDPDELISKWLIKNIGHQLFDMNKITSQVLVVGCVNDLNFLLQNVDNNILDMELVFTQVCKKKRNIVESFLKWMVTNVEKKKLNTHEMLILACIAQDIAVVKYLINNVDHNLLDLTVVLMSAMSSNWRGSNIDLIEWLFLHVDLKHINLLDIINKAFQEVRYEEIKTLITCSKDNFVNINHILINACENTQMELIKVVLSVVDHLRLNIRDAVRSVCVLPKMDLLEFFLHNVDQSLYNANYVIEISCRFGWVHILKWLLDNVEYSSVDVQRAFNTIYAGLMSDEIFNDDDNDNNYKKEKYLTLINLILDKVNHESLDLQNVLNQACRDCSSDVVKLLLENTDHKKLDVKKAMNIVYNLWVGNKREKGERLKGQEIDKQYSNEEEKEENKIGEYENDEQNEYEIEEQEAEKEENESGDKEEEDIDRENINKTKNKYKHLVMVILKQVNHDSLDLKKVFNQACQYGCLDVVTLVLENNNHTKLDIMEAVNIIYSSVRDKFDDINDQGKKYELLIKLILEKINHDLIDSIYMKEIMDKSCWYGHLDIVTFLLENTNHEKLDIMKAVNNAFSSIRDEDEEEEEEDEYEDEDEDDNNEKREKKVHLIKLILEKVDHDLLDLKEIMNIACRYGYQDVVMFLLEIVNHEKLDITEAVNIVYSLKWDDDDFNEEIKKKEPLIKLILVKVDHDLLDLKEIMELACWYGHLDMVAFLLENTDNEKLYIMEAIHSAYRDLFLYDCGINEHLKKMELLVKLILEKVDHDLLDLQEIMDIAFKYGHLDIVTFLLENTNHKKIDIMKAVNSAYNSFWYEDDIDEQKEKKENFIKLILEKVDHDLLDLKEIMNLACRCVDQDVVMFLLENTDHEKLDIIEALNKACSSIRGENDDKIDIHKQRDKMELLFKVILEKVLHDLLDLNKIMDRSCRYHYLDVVTFLLENTDHEKLNLMEAVNTANSSLLYKGDIDEQRKKKEPVIKLILEKVNHDLLDLEEIMEKACWYGHLDIVTFLLENTDHEKLDIMEAVIEAYSQWCFNYSYSAIKTKEPLVKLILEKVDHDLLDLKEIMDKACCYGYLDVVTFLLENTDNEKLDLMKAVNNAYRSISDEDDDEDDNNENRAKKEPLIKLILEKVDHDLLDLKEIMYKACCYGYLDVVTLLLENTDHEKLHVMEAVNKACNQSIDEETDDNSCNEKLIKKLLQRVKTDLLDMEVLMNEACRNGWLDIVRWLVENIDHAMFDVDTAFNLFIPHDSEQILVIFKLLLQIISPNLFNIGTVIEQASRLNHTEKVLWLLQNKDSSLFEMKYVMNEACRNSNLQIMKYVMENMDQNCVDVRSAMNKACRSSKPNSLEAVKWLVENIPHDMLDLESAMNNACRYDQVSVVEWFWTTLDRKLFNVRTAWNSACYNCNETLLSYLINTMDEKMLDKSKAMLQACRNYEGGDKVISLLFEQPNMNTPENCKSVLKEACVHSNQPIVKWLLENTDIQPSELKEMLIYTIKAEINRSNDEENSDHKSLVWFMLKHSKVKKLEQNDLSDVMEAVSSIGHLDMAQQLWNNTEQSMFNTRAIVNTACDSGKFEIADWFLQNIELTNIDVQTVMVESCGYGWLKIVKLLLSKFERENFDMRSSMKEACSYGRYEIVKFLLENIDSKLFDTKLVMETACGYGWKDITLWLFDNIDNISIDLKSCMFEACAQGRLEIAELFFSKYGASYFDVNILIDKSCNNCGNAGVIKFLIENFDLKQSHLDIIIKSASKHCWTEIVSSILDRCKNDKTIMEEAMKNACISGETEIVEIFLDKIDISFLGVNTNMNISCQKGWDEIVCLLLERVDHSLFDFTAAMNEACRCGEADVVELLIQKVIRENFNFDTAIVESCKSHLNENLVLILLKYINHSTIDIKAVSGKAYDNGWRRVSSRLKRMNYNDE